MKETRSSVRRTLRREMISVRRFGRKDAVRSRSHTTSAKKRRRRLRSLHGQLLEHVESLSSKRAETIDSAPSSWPQRVTELRKGGKAAATTLPNYHCFWWSPAFTAEHSSCKTPPSHSKSLNSKYTCPLTLPQNLPLYSNTHAKVLYFSMSCHSIQFRALSTSSLLPPSSPPIASGN